MKLLIISSGKLPVPPVNGGAVENLIKIFLDHNEKSFHHDITLYSIYSEVAIVESQKYKYTKIKYIKMHRILDKLNQLFRYLVNRFPNIYIGNTYISKVKRQLKSDLKNNLYDVIIVENNPEFALKLHDIAQGKLILHLHNDCLNLSTKLAKRIFECYKSIFAISEYINKSVCTIEHSSKVKTLYNGIDIFKFQNENYKATSRKVILEKIGVEKGEKIILYTGRLVPEKGVRELIMAFIELSDKYKVKLVIAGSATYGQTKEDKYYNDLIRISESKQESIIFTGYINYLDMPIIYSVANIGVVPSLCEEAFNLTVVEHMAAGNPLIISDAGAMPELIHPNGGVVVNRGEKFVENIKMALEQLLMNEKLQENMGNINREYSRKYDSSIYSNTFNKLLEELDD